MPDNKILEKLYKSVSTSEDEVDYGSEIPVDADTLKGHPLEYFASKSEVNQIMMNYMSTILGKSY